MTNTTQYLPYFINCSGTIHRVPSEGIYKYQIYVLFILCHVVHIPCFTLNLLLFISILRKKTVRTLPNYLMANVLLNNTLISVVGIVWSYNFLLGLYKKHNCVLYIGSVSACYICSLLSVIEVILLALDRYISICHPWFSFEHKACLKKSFIRCIFLIWILAIAFGSVGFLTPKFLYIKLLTASLAPVAIVISIVVHVKSYFAANSVIQQRKSSYGDVENSDPRTEILKTKDRRLYIITCVVILQLILFYSPLTGVVIYKTVTGSANNVLSTIFNWAVVAAGMKALFNPLTLLYQLISFRTALKDLLQYK